MRRSHLALPALAGAITALVGCPQDIVVGVQGTGGAATTATSSTTSTGGSAISGSTTTASSSSSSSGSEGDGGGGCSVADCNYASDCGASTGVCATYACVSHCCQATLAPPGVACSDSGGTTCDGNGKCVGACSGPADCPASACQVAACTNHTCGTESAPLGTPCSGSGPCCDGACMDFASDPHNCGACGNDCQGAACQNSLCAATTLVAAGTHQPMSFAVDGANLYWITTDGMVMEMPKGGGTATPLAVGQDSGPVAVDATSVYWNTGGNVVKCAIAGCNTQPTALVATQGTLYGLAVDATSVYWTTAGTGGAVLKAPIGGGASTLLAFGQKSPRSVAVDATYAYWDDDSAAIMKVPLAGGTPIVLTAGDGGYPGRIAIDGTNVYWGNSELETVEELPLSGGTPTVLATALFLGHPTQVVVDATTLYWTNSGASDMTGAVMKLPLGGGAPIPLVTGQTNPGPIALDATSVYWLSDDGIARVAK